MHILVPVLLIALIVFSLFKLGFMEDWRTKYESANGTVTYELDETWSQIAGLWAFVFSVTASVYTQLFFHTWWMSLLAAIGVFFFLAAFPIIIRVFGKAAILTLLLALMSAFGALVWFFASAAIR